MLRTLNPGRESISLKKKRRRTRKKSPSNALTVRIGDDGRYRLRERTRPHKFDEVPKRLPVVRPRGPRAVRSQPRFHRLVYHKVYHSLAYAYVGRHDTFIESQDTLRKKRS